MTLDPSTPITAAADLEEPNDDDLGYRARQPGAVDHVFALLERVADTDGGLTPRALVAQLPISRPTVYRIVKHLLEGGYLVRSHDDHRLVLGPRVQALAGTCCPHTATA